MPIVQVVQGAGLSSRVLTPDGSDRYGIGLSGGVIRVSAPTTNSGSNLRQVFWPTGESPSSDAQVCATWLDQDGQYVQQGVALRIVDGPSGTRALTVTMNIWAGNYWVFNVHTWDTSQTQPFTQIGQYDLAAVLRAATGAEPLPWRICAKVVDSALTFKVWLPDREAEPRLDRSRPRGDDPGAAGLPRRGESRLVRRARSARRRHPLRQPRPLAAATRVAAAPRRSPQPGRLVVG